MNQGDFKGSPLVHLPSGSVLNDHYWLTLSRPSTVEAFRGIYQVISDEIDHNFIIDTTALSGHPELFFDHIHPNPVGTRKIASIVSQALNDYVEEIGASQPTIQRTP